MLKYVPKMLLFSRLFFSFVILYFAVSKIQEAKYFVLALMYYGIISDIFDGIIARQLNISTENFRILDTVFDLVFYFSILFFIFCVDPTIIENNIGLISVLILLEAFMYSASLIRFQKLPSPHAVLSKFWGIYLIVEFTLVILGIKGNHWRIALRAGLIPHIDRTLIYFLLRTWSHDIPSAYHAFLLRQGKKITRLKLFNG